MRVVSRRALATLLLGVGTPLGLAAQLTATGSLTASGELYDRSGVGTAARPDQTGRMVANLTLGFGGLLTIPLTALISTDQVSFRQNINQLGVSPTWPGLTLHLGHFTPQYSRFTLTDATLLGGGVDVRRGMWRAGAVGGRVRKAIKPDTAGFPETARYAYGGRLGVGDEQVTALDLFFATARDDAGSLDTAVVQALPTAPEEYVLYGARARAAFAGRRLLAEVEATGSRYERDITIAAPATKSLAAAGKLTWDAGTWSLGATAEYLEPEFKTFGNAGLVGDRLEVGLTGRATLGQGRLSLTATGGWRQDDLEDNLDASTAQAIYSAGVSWQPGAAFGLDLQAANSVNDSRAKDDTSSVKNVTGQYTATPRLSWRTGAAQHVVVLVASLQRSDNSTPGSVVLVDTRTTALIGTWSVSLPVALALTLTATRTAVEVDTAETTVLTVQPGMTYTTLRGRLQASAQVQFTSITGGTGDDREIFPVGQVRYRITQGQSVQLRASVRNHELAAGSSFTESIVTLSYAATWR